MSKYTDDELRQVFNTFDTDHNGGIDASELSSVLRRYGIRLTDQDLQLAIKTCDTDGNGSIEFDEFKRAMNS